MLELERPVEVTRRLLRWFRSVILFKGKFERHFITGCLFLNVDEEFDKWLTLQDVLSEVHVLLILYVYFIAFVVEKFDCEFFVFNMGEDLKDFL